MVRGAAREQPVLQPVSTSADQAQYIYDDLGRLSQVIDGQGNVAIYTYDAVGNLGRRSSD